MKVLYCCGLNEDGQCAPEDETNIWYPSPVPFPRTTVSIAKVSAGSRHTLALTCDGMVYSWGWGQNGQLGLGVGVIPAKPTLIAELRDVMEISAGGMHSGCITRDHSVYTWGSSTFGQIGRDTSADSNLNFVPGKVTFPADENVLPVKISCGGMHTAIVDLKGSAYCWGKSDSGQTGYSDWYKSHSTGLDTPKRVMGVKRAVDVSCGGFHTMILKESGSVYAMGKEDFGCLGIGIVQDRLSVGTEKPTPISSLKGHRVKGVFCGGWHSVFLTDEGGVYACGKGEYGRLGLGEERSHTEPRLVVDAEGNCLSPIPLATGAATPSAPIEFLAAGGSHTVWANRKQVFTVGRVHGGRLGVGPCKPAIDRFTRANDISKNMLETSESRVVSVACGGAHTCVLVEYPEIPDDDEAKTDAHWAQVEAFYHRVSSPRTFSF